MGKPKVLTVEQLLAHNTAPINKTILWHGISISIRTLLPIQEVIEIVNSVMDGCYDETHDAFVPEMMDFILRHNVVTHYASVELPDEMDKQYEVLYNTDLYDTISAMVNKGQIEAIKKTIDICMNKG